LCHFLISKGLPHLLDVVHNHHINVIRIFPSGTWTLKMTGPAPYTSPSSR
jgi:hypothetical protein